MVHETPVMLPKCCTSGSSCVVGMTVFVLGNTDKPGENVLEASAAHQVTVKCWTLFSRFYKSQDAQNEGFYFILVN